MQDDEFFDLLYQQFSKTTGAEDCYWMPEPYPDPSGRNYIYAVGEGGSHKQVASGLKTEDADFITGVHGCLPDLIRKLRESLDEADRLDTEKDELLGRVADLERAADWAARKVVGYEERIKELEESEREADSYVEFLSNEIARLENGG